MILKNQNRCLSRVCRREQVVVSRLLLLMLESCFVICVSKREETFSTLQKTKKNV